MKNLLYLFLLCFSSFIQAQNDFDKNKIIDSLIRVVDANKDNFEKVKVLNSNAGKLRYTKETRVLIDKAIAIAKANNEDLFYAKSYYSLGNFFYYNSQLDSAIFYLDKSISYVHDETMPFLRASNLMTKSGVYRKQGNISLAIATMLNSKRSLDAIDTLKLNKDQRIKYKGEGLVLNNSLANYYNQMEEFNKAANYYDSAYKAALSLDSYTNAGIIISNKGELLLNQGKYTEALDLFKKGKALKEKERAPRRFIMSSILNIGNAHSKLENYDEAIVHLNEAHAFYEENNVSENLIIAKNYRGNLYFETNKYDLAIIDCNQAKSLALKTGNLELIADACDCLSKAYKATGNYEKALENYQLLTTAKDSIFNENNIKKQTQQEMQYVFNKTQELNALELKAKEKQNLLYLILALFGLVIAGLLGFFGYKNHQKNIKLAHQKQLLEATLDEKNTLLKEVHHRVKNSFQIVSSLLYLQSENTEDKEAKIAIKEAENRVRSMVLVHQKLYNKEELVGINSKEYITDLVKDIFESHQFQKKPINYQLDIASLVLNIETITPIGLILNELIINALKHAFNTVTDKSKLSVYFALEKDELILKVTDNGKGFKGEIENTSFGIMLMKALSKKLNATLNYHSEIDIGTEAILHIKKFKVLS